MVVWNAVKQIGSSRGRIANYASWHSCFWLGERPQSLASNPTTREEKKEEERKGEYIGESQRRATPREELQANPRLVGGHGRPRSPGEDERDEIPLAVWPSLRPFHPRLPHPPPTDPRPSSTGVLRLVRLAIPPQSRRNGVV